MESALIKALGVFVFDDKVFLSYQTSKNSTDEFTIDYSKNGQVFNRLSTNGFILDGVKKLDVSTISSFRMVKTGDLYNLLFLHNISGINYLCMASSRDMVEWDYRGRLFPLTEIAVQIPFYTHKNKEIIFFGGKSLNYALSTDSKNWNTQTIKSPVRNYILGYLKEGKDGPLLLYFIKDEHEDHFHFSLWSTLLDKKDPSEIIWSSNKALWMAPQEWIDENVTPIGIVELNDCFYSYWESPGSGIFCVEHKGIENYSNARSLLPHASLLKNEKNPILQPHPERNWENKQVFNPAAVLHGGKVHLLYRAVGEGDISVLGHAETSDGLTIDKRDAKPAYVPREDFEFSLDPGATSFFSKYMSGGGGYGGIEDPRITKIDDKFYLTYVAYDGKNPPRIALSFITIKDFDRKKWRGWSKPVLISPPSVINN